MMTPQQFFKRTLLGMLAVFLLPALVVAFFDPFFFFHKPLLHKDIGFDGTDRYQNAGLINSWLADPSERIDTIIVGTSMSQNLPVYIFRNDSGVNALKLTLSGGKAKELGMLVRKALETGRVKHVIWEVFTSYADPDPELVHDKSPLPVFLYDDSVLNDWRYVFNNDVVEEALKVALGRKGKRKPLESLYSWENTKRFKMFSAPENLEKLRAELGEADLPLQTDVDLYSPGFPNVDVNLLPILKNHPDIRFSLFFPPVSYYAYARQGQERFKRQMQMRAYLLQKTATLPHVTVHAFDLHPGWGSELSQYMDGSHYTPDISREIARAIAKNDSTIQAADFPNYADALAGKVNAFAKEFKASGERTQPSLLPTP